MEFERGPTRCAPEVPAPSVSYPLMAVGAISPLASYTASHEASKHSLRAEHRSTSRDSAHSTEAENPIYRQLQRQLKELERREAALLYSEQLFHERVAAWEKRCRLWEAQYAERLAQLDGREARLGEFSS